jgi:GNAT superfamily N-acetyltransferase
MAGRLGEFVPAALIGKLALDQSLQSRGFGGALLVDALERILSASHSGPAVKLVIVHAYSDHARRMYHGYGFSDIPSSPNAMALKLEAFSKAQERISRS